MKPKNIYLVRHGESLGNIDKSVYTHTPDWKVSLTEKGKQQAIEAAEKLSAIILPDNAIISSYDIYDKVQVYCSPWFRTRQTAAEYTKHPKNNMRVKYTEDPRLREQDWGNYQEKEVLKQLAKERDNYGTFFYRLPNGESGADVYDRISTFLETLHRNFDKVDFPQNVVIFSHGITIRIFLMRFFHWSVEEYENTKNIRNCEIVHMKLNGGGKYKLITELRKRSSNAKM